MLRTIARYSLLSFALFTLVGCLMQPVDQTTGKAFGPAVSLNDVPTTSPSGNPVYAVPTKDIDYRRIADEVAGRIAPVVTAATPPGYQQIVNVLFTAGVAGLYELSRKREQKALYTPPPGQEGK